MGVEGMFSRLPADAHSAWRPVEPLLHGIQDTFV
jgi:hypothetical protein